ncbi:hypothetical protein TREES_T100001717 [Tupaia chinensis]|uniref:Uncharacterized protein n=1 Tax=Tupaia chinensis TaxID=246437 RepID=L9KKB0_TUPCH|nr:hypothetical protein TREES_T100001717 [Tupaia chinensis]
MPGTQEVPSERQVPGAIQAQALCQLHARAAQEVTKAWLCRAHAGNVAVSRKLELPEQNLDREFLGTGLSASGLSTDESGGRAGPESEMYRQWLGPVASSLTL